MLFAQTGSTTSLPTKSAQEEVNPALIALWWIVPLAIAAIWIALTVRSNQVKEARRRSLRKDESVKLKELAKSSDSKNELQSISTNVNRSEKENSRLPVQSKTKKEKSKGKNKTRPQTPAMLSTNVDAETEPLHSSEPSHSLDEQVSKSAPTMAANATISEQKTSNAIFEPLRDASKARRKAPSDEILNSRAERSDSPTRENDAYNQLFGGKFERIIPKQTLRSTANRWPASETQPTRINPSLERQVPTEPTQTSTLTPQSTPAVDAPAKGLKSFVSKVKSPPALESQSTPANEDLS